MSKELLEQRLAQIVERVILNKYCGRPADAEHSRRRDRKRAHAMEQLLQELENA